MRAVEGMMAESPAVMTGGTGNSGVRLSFAAPAAVEDATSASAVLKLSYCCLNEEAGSGLVTLKT